ncbi:hypothetical protein CVT26_012063 [Gymnopilus dilepis]|uniref:Uncharacterized protein n=1 Tax=Gymnopilus dilepis TaxID=231916 RepID=A0A409W987_9AGAR|nr:hypothetical protein CVT26_012063 [Gymnopilus dilepis]
MVPLTEQQTPSFLDRSLNGGASTQALYAINSYQSSKSTVQHFTNFNDSASCNLSDPEQS